MVYCGTGKIKRLQEKKAQRREKELWRQVPLRERLRWYLYRISSSILNTGFIKKITPGHKPSFSIIRAPHGHKRPAPERRGRRLTATSDSPFSSPSALKEAAAAATTTTATKARARNTDVYYIEQTQSVLFAKLPFEIRRMIFIAVLGGEVLHFIDWPSKYKPYIVCLKAATCHWTELERCWQCFYNGIVCADNTIRVPGKSKYRFRAIDGEKPLIEGFRGGNLGLVMSCRRIYSEAIDLLYSHNTFNIREQRALSTLHANLPPQRWNAIRSITMTSTSLCISRGDKKVHWGSLLLSVSFMPCLQSLRILVMIDSIHHLSSDWAGIWWEMGPTLLCVFEELRKFDWLKEFEIAVPYLGQAEMDMLGEGYPGAPFRFVPSDG